MYKRTGVRNMYVWYIYILCMYIYIYIHTLHTHIYIYISHAVGPESVVVSGAEGRDAKEVELALQVRDLVVERRAYSRRGKGRRGDTEGTGRQCPPQYRG